MTEGRDTTEVLSDEEGWQKDGDPCNDCRQPANYDEATGWYYHVDPNAPECFLMGSGAPEPAAKVCGQPITYRVAYGVMNGHNVHGECEAHATLHSTQGYVVRQIPATEGLSFGRCLCPALAEA